MSTFTKSSTSEHINILLQTEIKQLLERAAGLEGTTVGHFILHSALKQAEKTIHAHETMRLNAKDSAQFLHALQHPAPWNAHLTAALAEHEQRVRSQ